MLIGSGSLLLIFVTVTIMQRSSQFLALKALT
jgi:hypothetical protein